MSARLPQSNSTAELAVCFRSMAAEIAALKQQVASLTSGGGSATKTTAAASGSATRVVQVGTTGESGGSVSWSAITNKPVAFTPTSHFHAIADVTGLQGVLDGKASSVHRHSINDMIDLSAAAVSTAGSLRTMGLATASDVLLTMNAGFERGLSLWHLKEQVQGYPNIIGNVVDVYSGPGSTAFQLLLGCGDMRFRGSLALWVQGTPSPWTEWRTVITDKNIDTYAAAVGHTHNLDELGIPDGNVDFGAFQLTSVGTPTHQYDAANKYYVDAHEYAKDLGIVTIPKLENGTEDSYLAPETLHSYLYAAGMHTHKRCFAKIPEDSGYGYINAMYTVGMDVGNICLAGATIETWVGTVGTTPESLARFRYKIFPPKHLGEVYVVDKDGDSWNFYKEVTSGNIAGLVPNNAANAWKLGGLDPGRYALAPLINECWDHADCDIDNIAKVHDPRFYLAGNATNKPAWADSGHAYSWVSAGGEGPNRGIQWFADATSIGWRERSNNAWKMLIHSGNIGSQSVANADTLDGYHATAFAAAAHTHDFSATYAAKAHSHVIGDLPAYPTLSSLGAAAASHTHDYSATYAAKSHTHAAADLPAYPTLSSLGAAAASHTHTLAALGAAASSHTHMAIGGLTAVAKGNGTAMQFGDTSTGVYQLYSTGGQLYLARIS